LTGAGSTIVPLTSSVYLTGNALAPCPRCIAGFCDATVHSFNGPNGKCTAAGVPFACCSGAVAGTGTGLCAADPCTTTNAFMTTHDCGMTPGALLGAISVDLTPLTTGTASMASATGLFCPGQAAPTNPAVGPKPGCFGDDPIFGVGSCRRIEETGLPAGPLTLNGPPATTRLASVFCIPETPGALAGLINLAAGLPGPGATSLPGEVELHN
jgi:hypothetical protein